MAFTGPETVFAIWLYADKACFLGKRVILGAAIPGDMQPAIFQLCRTNRFRAHGNLRQAGRKTLAFFLAFAACLLRSQHAQIADLAVPGLKSLIIKHLTAICRRGLALGEFACKPDTIKVRQPVCHSRPGSEAGQKNAASDAFTPFMRTKMG